MRNASKYPARESGRAGRAGRARYTPVVLLGLGFTTASFATDKSWNAGNGAWSTAGNWTPAGMPGVNDVVRIGNLPGVQNAVVNAAGAIWVPDAIEISDGMTLDTGGMEFVGSPFPVSITGGNSRLIIRPHAGGNQRDFIGQLYIGPGAHLELADNVPIHQFVEAFTSWGRIEGVGDLLVESATPFSNNGVINPGGDSGLRITQHWAPLPPIDLDGSADFGQVWLDIPFSILEVNASGLADPFDGVINMDPGTLLTMNMVDGWEVDSGGVINASGGIANAAAQINGDDLTFGGSMNVSNAGILRILSDTVVEPSASTWVFADSRLEYDGTTTVNGGWFHLGLGAAIDFDGGTTIRGGEFYTQSTDPADGVINFNAPSTTWNGSEGPIEINGVARQMGNGFVGGPTVINAEVFDMDGDGDTLWTIWNDMTIDAESIQADGDGPFMGTINVANGTLGRLTVWLPVADHLFRMGGEMNLFGHPSVWSTRYDGTTLDLTGALNVNGLVAMSGYLRAMAGTIDIAAPTAVLRLDAGGLIAGNCAFSGDGELRSTSSLLFAGADLGGVGFVNHGHLNTSGFANVDRFEQRNGAAWEVSLRGYEPGVQYDQLRVTGGDATLAGDLEVEIFELPAFPAFTPVIGDEFTILTVTGSVAGAFSGNPSTIYQGHRYDWNVLYGRSNVRLRLVAIIDCPFGDLDNDGDIDLQDLAILLSNFGAASGADWSDGDLDGDNDVDISDLATLLSHYGSSCA